MMGHYLNTLFWLFGVNVEVSASLPRWLSLLGLIAQVTIVGLIFRTWIGPSILRHISDRVRIRSISPRSVRGIFIRTGSTAWHVDRVGLSYHRPSLESARRFSVKIEGLHLEINGCKRKRTESSPMSHNGSKNAYIFTKFVLSPIAYRTWALYSIVYTYLEPYVRPVVRTFSVAIFRLIIRSLPALTQVLDFELDQFTISFTALSGALIVMKNATLYTKVTFTQLESVIGSKIQEVPMDQKQRHFLNMAHWKVRFTKSIGRVWDRAWGNTQGSASIVLDIGGVTGFTHPAEFSLLRSSSESSDFTSRYLTALQLQKRYRRNAFIDLSGTTGLIVSLRFNPKRGAIENHSVTTSFTIPAVHIRTDRLISLLQLFEESNKDQNEYRSYDVPQTFPTPSPAQNTGSLLSISPVAQPSSTPAKFRRRSSRPAKRLQASESTLLSVLQSIDLTIVSATLDHNLPYGSRDNGESGQVLLTAHFGKFAVTVQLSAPERNVLHRQHLGHPTRGRDQFDADVYAFSCSTEHITIHRIDDTAAPERLALLSIGPVDLQSLITQWLASIMAHNPFLLGDPNASLLVCHLVVSSVEFIGQLDIISYILTLLESTKTKPTSSSPLHHILSHVPRMVIELQIRDINGCLLLSSDEHRYTSPIIIQSDVFMVRMSSEFKYMSYKQTTSVAVGTDEQDPLELQFMIHSVLGSTFLRVSTKDSSSENSTISLTEMPNPNINNLPLLSFSALELLASGQTLGTILDDSCTIVSLDMKSTMVEVLCTTDAIAVELWHPAVISAVSSAVGLSRSAERSSPPDPSGLLDWLPSGVSAYLGVGRLDAFVTAPDLNPNDDLELSRGVALHSGISVQYCSFQASRHIARLSRRFGRAHARQRLNLSEELPMDAISISNSQNHANDKYALVRSVIWRTVLRAAVATRFAIDHYDLGDEEPEVKLAEYLWIEGAQLDTVLRRDRNKTLGLPESLDRCHVSFKIPYIRASCEMLHAYCTLLTLQTLKSIISARGHSHESHSHLHMVVSCKGSIETVQVLGKFPLLQQLCLRLNGLSVHLSSNDSIQVSWGTLFAWVPTCRQDRKWEELTRLQAWSLSCSRSNTWTFVVEGEGARLRIPHDFVIADLILDLNVTFKCLQHLARIVSSGVFVPIEAPGHERAKKLPAIVFRVGCLTVEAADDPLESKLALIWKAGFDASKTRQERDEAFEAKAATISAAESQQDNNSFQGSKAEYRFTPQHSISVGDARQRLYQVHAIAWVTRHREFQDEQLNREAAILRQLRGGHVHHSGADIASLVDVSPASRLSPLIRMTFRQLSLNITSPTLTSDGLADFLYDVGNGLPQQTQFSLLLPIHLNLSLGPTCVNIRDYPLPLLNIPPNLSGKSWEVNTDFVVGEELGPSSSVFWKDCCVIPSGSGIRGGSRFSILVPKTSMPVKTYANPTIHVITTEVTDFCWGVSYNPALQDVLRILETLSTPPPDPSPPMGFWDKMRLVLHWRIKIFFTGEVQLNLKGSRDPYVTQGTGAGFSFCWNGNTEMTVCHPNADNELLQVTSDTMLVVIPNLRRFENGKGVASFQTVGQSKSETERNRPSPVSEDHRKHQKICAKFTSGIQWGVGFVLERTCGRSCSSCNGRLACRLFNFRPHYEVLLEPKQNIPQENSSGDSYNEFRSDYIHLSTSLTSSPRHFCDKSLTGSNSFHLTPKAFAHFWAWWALFDGALSLPIRQGKQFPNTRPPSKKFGRHLATLKYRLSLCRLFISHVYVDDSRESWSNGVVNCVGIKAMIDHFQADMHQREQEAIVAGVSPSTMKKIRHKPFYAAEINLTDLDLRAMIATFEDPLKQLTPIDSTSSGSSYRNVKESPQTDFSSPWVDLDDFVEVDWFPSDARPVLHLLPITCCPRFTYFKRTSTQNSDVKLAHGHKTALESSRFGSEDTHVCLMGQEASVYQVQMDLVALRVSELDHEIAQLKHAYNCNIAQDEGRGKGIQQSETLSRIASLDQKVNLLKSYAEQLHESMKKDLNDHQTANISKGESTRYFMPSDIFIPSDWAVFDNVYQFHCPKIFISNSTRDSLMQYYYCSRARRGFEYHMATRAVKFIRDQADAITAQSTRDNTKGKKNWNPATGAQAAAHAIRKILSSDDSDVTEPPINYAEPCKDRMSSLDPMSGWSEGVILNKSHFCLLLKPQVILRSDASEDSICILTALQATLQGFAILDATNAEDPISGRVMTRSYALLNGLQTFAPSSASNGHDYVPLEILLDLRCDCSDFDRLVPQTDATFQYDKFNRLRLRNNITSVMTASSGHANSHLQHQTDLIDVRVPQFSVSANAKHFQAISNILTNLLLVSNSAHKAHLSKVETLLFSYDFTDLASAAGVVADLQARLRSVVDIERNMTIDSRIGGTGNSELLKLKTHIFDLTEELNLIFDAIKLAQDKADGHQNDLKSALRLHASSSEISWGMLNDTRELLVKLAVRGIDFSWLSRQDSSTVNTLDIGDLQAFDGSPNAEWPEILTKHKEPSYHPLVKREIFVHADWSVLAPVGGITIYEHFILNLHPMRLQLDGRVGRNVMEYLWPARRNRKRISDLSGKAATEDTKLHDLTSTPNFPRQSIFERSSLDLPRASSKPSSFVDDNRLTPRLRTVSVSRSFTDLRQASHDTITAGRLQRAQSSEALNAVEKGDGEGALAQNQALNSQTDLAIKLPFRHQHRGDAAEMKTRSSQKTFVLVRITSIHLILSIRKEDSFFCRDARIRTRELEYRNETWSFEELADQFIPSDPSWKGWVRIAFQQPLVPILPVARELISKTKWIMSKGQTSDSDRRKSRPSAATALAKAEKSGMMRLRIRRRRPHSLPGASMAQESDVEIDRSAPPTPRIYHTARS